MVDAGILTLGLMALSASVWTGPSDGDGYRDAKENRQMALITAYQAAHMAELGAFCLKQNAGVGRLKAELMSISAKAQARNPDDDLSSLEATTGLDISRFSVGDAQSFCATSDQIAIPKFTLAMTELRKFSNKWR